MSAPLEVIRSLLLGRAEAAGELLGACRTYAYGAEAFGGAMAARMFARQPAGLSREPHVIATPQGMAVFDTDAEGRDQAIFADLYDGRVGRIWRLGGGTTDADAEPALLLGADPMLTQLRTPLALSPGDHPGLGAAAAPALRALTAAVARLSGPGEREVIDGRAFVVRAFTEGDRGAALLALARPTESVLQVLAGASFRFAAAGLTHSHVVFDQAPKPTPRPGLVATAAPPDERTP